jgi:ankyrin repeat protein
VRLLLATGKVDVNSRDDDGWTPLSTAAEGGHKAVVKFLEEFKTNRHSAVIPAQPPQ